MGVEKWVASVSNRSNNVLIVRFLSLYTLGHLVPPKLCVTMEDEPHTAGGTGGRVSIK